MCGIAGIINLDRPATPEEIAAVRKMVDAQTHRGPDDVGVSSPQPSRLRSSASSSSIVLGHRRLSIIDLSEAGRQPMCNTDESVWITYNGEIYNHQTLRNELIREGYRFRSRTDTEVLLHGYKAWGKEGLLHRLRGMFAFALWDRDKETLFAARDRFGIKPFYYAERAGRLDFASELKALVRSGSVSGDIDPEALYLYLAWGSIPAPKTFYRGIAALPPAHWLTFNRNGLRLERYWNMADCYGGCLNRNVSEQEANEIVHAALLDSVRAHLVSDVPVGAFLSGGVDSSAIVSLMREAGQSKIKTFTVVFPDDPELNEGPAARRIAEIFETEHAEIEVTPEEFYQEWDRVTEAMDQPTVDGVNSYFVSRAARQAGAKVALSGLGGDELFGGYPSFHQVPWLWKARRFSKRFRLSGPLLTRLLPGKSIGRKEKLRHLFEQPPEFNQTYFAYRGLFMPREIDALLSPKLFKQNSNGLDPVSHLPHLEKYRDPWERVAILETGTYMTYQLLRDTDVMSMAHSLEVRVPLVDHVLLGEVAALSVRTKGRPDYPKATLVEILPETVREDILRKGKRGFTFPFDRWLKGPLRERIEKRLIDTAAHYFAQEKVQDLWRNYLDGTLHWSRVWSLAAMEPPGKEERLEAVDRIEASPKHARPTESVLVYRTGQLGDTICAIPAIRALRDNLGGCRIVLLTDIHPQTAHPRAHEVLSEFGLIDDYLVYNPKQIFSPRTILNLRKQIALRRIRTAVYLAPRHRGLFQKTRDYFFFKSCGIQSIHGLRFLDGRIKGPSGRHEVERLLNVLRIEGFQVDVDPVYDLPATKEVQSKVDETWARERLDGKKVVAVSPGSKMPVKRWGVENYRSAGMKLIDDFNAHLLLLGGSEDREMAEELANTWGNRCTNLTGRTSYMESAEILRRCAFYLGNDSGAMHLAAAVGTRCVAIFSARDAAGAWNPYGTGHTVLRKRVECEGCMLTDCVEERMKCIADISVDEVIEACGKYLAPLNVGATAGTY